MKINYFAPVFLLSSLGLIGLPNSNAFAATVTDYFESVVIERGAELIHTDRYYNGYPWGYWDARWYYYQKNKLLSYQEKEYYLTWNPEYQEVLLFNKKQQEYKSLMVFEVYYSIDGIHYHDQEWEPFLFETEEIYYEVRPVPEPLTILGAGAAILWGVLIRKSSSRLQGGN
jgi:hypothetical protein